MRSVLASAAASGTPRSERRVTQRGPEPAARDVEAWDDFNLVLLGHRSTPHAYPGSTALQGFFVTGTDTDVGKTVVSAWLLTHLDADYWKPVQAGNRARDRRRRPCAGLPKSPPDRILPEAYVLPEAIAPHEAARRAGITIDMAKLEAPATDRLLIVEGAGGLLVPLDRQRLCHRPCGATASAGDPRRPLHPRHHQPYAPLDRSLAAPRACRSPAWSSTGPRRRITGRPSSAMAR